MVVAGLSGFLVRLLFFWVARLMLGLMAARPDTEGSHPIYAKPVPLFLCYAAPKTFPELLGDLAKDQQATSTQAD